MKLEEKLYKQMLLRGLNQQRLAQLSGVSDSEISRLLNGQSRRPGLHSLHRIAKVLAVSLEFLADDALVSDPRGSVEAQPREEREVLERARSIGLRQTLMLLDTARVLGFELAIRRLVGAAPRPGLPDEVAGDPRARAHAEAE